MNNPAYPEIPPTDVHPEESLTNPEAEHQFLKKLNNLEAQLESLNHIFEQRLTYDKEKEKAFDLLYSELQSLKENSAFDSVKPLYFDLILLLDRVENIKESITDEKFSTQSNTMKDILQTVIEEVLEILFRQEVEVMKTAPGMLFDPSQQKAIQIQETSVESENNKVFSIIRHGFRYGNRILRPEEVIVSKYHRA